MHNRRNDNMNNKAKDFAGSLKKIIKYNKPFVTLIIISLVLSFISSILSIIGPDKLKDITNTIKEGLMTGIDLEKVKNIGLVLAIMYIISAIFNYLQGFIMTIVNNKFQLMMRSDIDKKINRLPLSYFDKTTVGDILSRITNDVDTIGWTMNQSLSGLVSSLTTLLGAIFMRGNPFFTQERPGFHEHVFKLVKFRTMDNRRDANGELLPDEVRLNKYGRFLRASSLDELPELFNILAGDMALIGPRPLLVKYLSRYNEEQRHRHDVRPGLTGWAQVHGRKDVEWHKRIELNVWYVDHVSFWLDTKIFFMTIFKELSNADNENIGETVAK